MARIFITGSADGLGQLAAIKLVGEQHRVVLHARNAERGRQALERVPGAETVVTGDLSNREETIQLAAAVNKLGPVDAIIHNAGVYREPGPVLFSVNILAPYILTMLIKPPRRLVYLSSGMHLQGDADFKRFRPDNRNYTYSDSKLHVAMLAMAVARKWPGVYSNAVDPGWVPTKMGGAGAPDNLEQGVETQAWLAVSDDAPAKVSGEYFYHRRKARFKPEARDAGLQERLLALCAEFSGVPANF